MTANTMEKEKMSKEDTKNYPTQLKFELDSFLGYADLIKKQSDHEKNNTRYIMDKIRNSINRKLDAIMTENGFKIC